MDLWQVDLVFKQREKVSLPEPETADLDVYAIEWLLKE